MKACLKSFLLSQTKNVTVCNAEVISKQIMSILEISQQVVKLYRKKVVYFFMGHIVLLCIRPNELRSLFVYCLFVKILPSEKQPVQLEISWQRIQVVLLFYLSFIVSFPFIFCVYLSHIICHIKIKTYSAQRQSNWI